MRDLPVDVSRGTHGMALFILTEALLFVVLFFGYFYIGHQHPVWPTDPPELKPALIMLAVLIASSLVLFVGEHGLRRGRSGLARAAMAVTILLGASFLALQAKEYHTRLATLRPSSDAYGSLFYTITSLHGLHVVLGLLMLLYALCLPTLGDGARSPHRPLHNASLYWHFVDVVWIAVVGLLYVLPRATT